MLPVIMLADFPSSAPNTLPYQFPYRSKLAVPDQPKYVSVIGFGIAIFIFTARKSGRRHSPKGSM
jgi:hypothetical protein